MNSSIRWLWEGFKDALKPALTVVATVVAVSVGAVLHAPVLKVMQAFNVPVPMLDAPSEQSLGSQCFFDNVILPELSAVRKGDRLNI